MRDFAAVGICESDNTANECGGSCDRESTCPEGRECVLSGVDGSVDIYSCQFPMLGDLGESCASNSVIPPLPASGCFAVPTRNNAGPTSINASRTARRFLPVASWKSSKAQNTRTMATAPSLSFVASSGPRRRTSPLATAATPTASKTTSHSVRPSKLARQVSANAAARIAGWTELYSNEVGGTGLGCDTSWSATQTAYGDQHRLC